MEQQVDEPVTWLSLLLDPMFDGALTTAILAYRYELWLRAQRAQVKPSAEVL